MLQFAGLFAFAVAHPYLEFQYFQPTSSFFTLRPIGDQHGSHSPFVAELFRQSYRQFVLVCAHFHFSSIFVVIGKHLQTYSKSMDFFWYVVFLPLKKRLRRARMA